MKRTYDWNGHTHEISMGFHSDRQIAAMIRSLMRQDIGHEHACMAARDRIMALSKEKCAMKQAIINAVDSLRAEAGVLQLVGGDGSAASLMDIAEMLVEATEDDHPEQPPRTASQPTNGDQPDE